MISDLRFTMTHRIPFFLLIAICVAPALGAAPMVKTQAPGFYRIMIGDFEVTALNDGVVPYSTSRLLPKASAEQIAIGLSEHGLKDPVGMSYNAFLVNTGAKLVLIDAGTGGKLADQSEFRGSGHLLANLRAAGYRPEQVDEVYITHLGPDHVGGLTVGSLRAFPNAVLRAPQAEVNLFLHPETAAAWTKNWRRFWAELFRPYMDGGKFQAFDNDTTLTPGIRSLATHGHAVGHTSFVVKSAGQTLIVMGDLVLVGALQFKEPSLTSSFDADPEAAAEQRRRILKLASENGYWLAGSHVSFPGIGHVRPVAEGYSWLPVNYAVEMQ